MNDTDFIEKYKPDHVDLKAHSTFLYWGDPDKEVLKLSLYTHDAILELANIEGITLIGDYTTYGNKYVYSQIEKLQEDLKKEITKLKAKLCSNL
jgi:hypothetical protein